MSYVNYSDASAAGYGATGQVQSGQWKGARFGLKGSEDLGNGLSAIFQQEFGMVMTSTTAQQHNEPPGSV